MDIYEESRKYPSSGGWKEQHEGQKTCADEAKIKTSGSLSLGFD